MTKPLVAVASLGGTITMTAASRSAPVTPGLGAADLVAAVPELSDVAELQVATLATVPGASLSWRDVVAAVRWAGAAVDQGARGVVLVQGTDTLEETAYVVDLLWDRAAPVVLTGAMRPPQQPGADGPANLLAAVRVAGSEVARDCGALVVMNDEVHAARHVRKTHAYAVQAFRSPGRGPVGQVVEGRVRCRGPARIAALPLPTREPLRVALIESSLDDGGELLDLAVADGYDGLVLSAFGAGHVSVRTAERVNAAAAAVPVVVASRTGAGRTLQATYGFVGSETDLVGRGALLAGSLDPRKARLLLRALLGAGADRAAIAEEFERRGGGLGRPEEDWSA